MNDLQQALQQALALYVGVLLAGALVAGAALIAGIWAITHLVL